MPPTHLGVFLIGDPYAHHCALELGLVLAQLPEQLCQQGHMAQAVSGATAAQLVTVPGRSGCNASRCSEEWSGGMPQM